MYDQNRKSMSHTAPLERAKARVQASFVVAPEVPFERRPSQEGKEIQYKKCMMLIAWGLSFHVSTMRCMNVCEKERERAT